MSISQRDTSRRAGRGCSRTTLALAIATVLAGVSQQSLTESVAGHASMFAMPSVFQPRMQGVMFIDARIPELAKLMRAAAPGTRMMMIDPHRDGLRQVADWLDSHRGTSRVALVAHGAPGELQLGARMLDAGALDARAATLARIGRAMAPGGELMIYGCDTGAGERGARFVGTLAALTGRGVAASDDVTGKDGDWDLEVVQGRVEDVPMLSAAALGDYANDLATLTVTSNADSGASTLRAAIAAASSGDSITVTADSATSFTVTLNSADRAAIGPIVNKNGSSSTGDTTYNLAAAVNWDDSASADLTGNGIIVSNAWVPSISSATYDAATGTLTGTGTGLVSLTGLANDIVDNKFTFTGEGPSTYTLTDTPNADIASDISFTLHLSANDKAGIDQIVNENGTSSTDGATNNLAAAEDWAAGADPAVVVADTTGNGITAINIVDAAPTVTISGGSASFVAGDNAASTPVAVDDGLIVSDVDNISLASAMIAITGNFHAGEDVLSFTNDGATMGNISASYDAATGVMTLTSAGATATLAQWQAALRSVTYTDTAVTPDTATRTVSFSVNDGAADSAVATRTVAVTATDQTPIVTTTGGTTGYVNSTAPVTIDGGITVSDLDNSTQSSAIVSIGAGFHNGDVLGFTNDGLTMGNIIATYNPVTGTLTLLSGGSTATDAQWASALSSVTFSSTSASYGNRTIDFSTNDGVKTSAVATDTVDVLGPPQITTDSGSVSFVAGDNTASTPVVIDAGLTVTDGTSSTLAVASIAITGGFHAGEDVLAFANDGATMGNIGASYDAATGVLTLTSAGATATLAQWQAALDSVTYTDTAITPDTATRTVSFKAVDGGGTTSNTATRAITVTATEQSPIVTTTGGTTDYVAGTAAVTIDGSVTVSDLDNSTQSSAIVSIGAGFSSGDVLGFINTSSALFGNVTASYNAATGVITLTSAGGTATNAQWASALSSVTFSSTSASYGNRTIDFSANDGVKTSAAATDTVILVEPLPALSVSVDDARDYARYGRMQDYVVTVSNNGEGDATGVSLSSTYSPGLVAEIAQWQCFGGGAAGVAGVPHCDPSTGTGAMASTLDLPSGASLSFLVSVPVDVAAADPEVQVDVEVDDASHGIQQNASDTDTLVLFRDGFDVPYADGTQSVSPQAPETAALQSPCSGTQALTAQDTPMVSVPAHAGEGLIDSLYDTGVGDDHRVVVQRLSLDATPWVRLFVAGESGDRVSPWAAAAPGATMALGLGDDGNGRWLLLEGKQASLRLSLPDVDASGDSGDSGDNACR